MTAFCRLLMMLALAGLAACGTAPGGGTGTPGAGDRILPGVLLSQYDKMSIEYLAYRDVGRSIEIERGDRLYAGQYDLLVPRAHDNPKAVVFRVEALAGDILYVTLSDEIFGQSGPGGRYFLAGSINLDDTPSGADADKATAYRLREAPSNPQGAADIALYDATGKLFRVFKFDPNRRRYRASSPTR